MIVRWFAGPLIVVAVLGTEAAVSWTTVDGGGATSTAAGPYRLRGTIGQSDGATLSAEAGPSVRGGYWPGAVALSRLVFEDDFESGDTSAWSSVTPLAATAAASSGGSLRSAEPGSERLGEALAAEVLPLGTPLDIPTLDTASLIAFAALILAAAGRLIHRRSST